MAHRVLLCPLEACSMAWRDVEGLEIQKKGGKGKKLQTRLQWVQIVLRLLHYLRIGIGNHSDNVLGAGLNVHLVGFQISQHRAISLVPSLPRLGCQARGECRLVLHARGALVFYGIFENFRCAPNKLHTRKSGHWMMLESYMRDEGVWQPAPGRTILRTI